MLYELRVLKSAKQHDEVLGLFEPLVRRWRGHQRWYMHVFTSGRGEVVLQVVGEKNSASVRLDNAYTSWRGLLEYALDSPGLFDSRREWYSLPSSSHSSSSSSSGVLKAGKRHV